ncbi:MAG: DUF362 domain-containing protein [Candidatus Lokiarchaeota archaeon]|nr:DUF362 domain-containing protein [Candidatus Lokiarchaeota archaeon]
MNDNIKGKMVNTTIGSKALDKDGSAISACRVDVERAYKNVSKLLQKFIQDNDKESWTEIKVHINYIYNNLSKSLIALDQETGYIAEIKNRTSKGQNLLFKPNLVSMENINPYNQGSAFGSNAVTNWTVMAALLRFFHDDVGISYYKMSMGEASSNSAWLAAHYTLLKGSKVTPEATMEGRSDDFYGGHGFYFVRKYLSEESSTSLEDDAMKGFKESVAGTFIPPGLASDKLMVYDLNKLSDSTRGREVSILDGENFKSLVLHKIIIGGDPGDPEDLALYPPPVIINVSKLKVHTQSLITNAIKNFGIGFYSMEVPDDSNTDWKYAKPDFKIPTIRSPIPHQVWIPEQDPITFIPKKDANGKYIVKKTGGLTGTILDMVKAVVNQGIYMLHIVDSINAVNLDHQGIGFGREVSEGLLFASLDPVAIDLLCARYIFSNVGLKESREAGLKDGAGGYFPQAVPVPKYDGSQIITEKGYDCPIQRDLLLLRAEQEGFGKRDYYVVGHDDLTDNSLASVEGRLGFIKEGQFNEIITNTLYFDIYKLPWDLQKTFFNYLDAIEKVEGIALKHDFIDIFDEDKNGIVDFEEFGKKGLWGTTMYINSHYLSARGLKDESEMYRTLFATLGTRFRNTNPKWNPGEHDIQRENSWGSITILGLNMYQAREEKDDPFIKELKWGKGKWPSFTFTHNIYVHQQLYGFKFPASITTTSLYGIAFCNADYTQNRKKYIGPIRGFPEPNSVDKYLEAVSNGEQEPLDFTFYVPIGYGVNGKIPNVQETSDPEKILTVKFNGGTIRWPDARPAPLKKKELDLVIE